MRLSVIIVSWNVSKLLSRCLDTLAEEIKDIDAEVFVVDNNSADDSAHMVRRDHGWVHLIANDSNRGFAAANNQAIKLASGEFVLLLNPDTEVKSGAIKEMISFLETNTRAGVVAPQLINSDGSIQRSCREFPTFLNMVYELVGLTKMFPNVREFGRYKMLDFNHDRRREVDQPEGACLLVKREVLDQVGTLDEGYFMLFEEVDWCYRIKQAGWQIWFEPAAKVVHHYGQSIKQVRVRMIISSHKGLYRFWTKHYCRGRYFMKPFVYAGLMTLAAARIVAHNILNALRGGGPVVLKAPAVGAARPERESVSAGRK